MERARSKISSGDGVVIFVFESLDIVVEGLVMGIDRIFENEGFAVVCDGFIEMTA